MADYVSNNYWSAVGISGEARHVSMPKNIGSVVRRPLASKVRLAELDDVEHSTSSEQSV
jgi:hypothetical protein